MLDIGPGRIRTLVSMATYSFLNQKNQKIFIGLNTFSNQLLIYFADSLCIDFPVKRCKITVIPFGSMLSNLKGH